MARQDRPATPAVKRDLLENCHRFSFYQAVRLLERSQAHRAPLGRQGPAAREAVRLRPNASLAFPTCDVESIEEIPLDSATEASQFLMTVNFLGLYGPASPLPTFYTEEVLHANPDESERRNFLDLFDHRLLALLYRCWEKYRYYVQYQPEATDTFSQWMFALIGLGGAALRQDSPISWPRLLPYLGLLGLRASSATMLTSVVADYFGGLPVHVVQCVGRWVPLEPDQYNVLGEGNCTLGEDSVLGERFYDRSGKFTLCIGPVDFATFQQFLPTGTHYQTVRELVRFSLRDQLAFDVEMVLMASEVPELILAEDQPCWLGWSTWLGGKPETDAVVTFPGEQG